MVLVIYYLMVLAKVEKQNLSPRCRMCGEKDESVGHLVGECSKLAQAKYNHRHDNVARDDPLEHCTLIRP